MHTDEAFFEGEEEKSRSAKKRDSTAMQKRGEELFRLGSGVWAKLQLPEDLAGALEDLARMKKHEARRRQMQYIGRLVREMDDEARENLFAFLDDAAAGFSGEKELMHKMERLRDALLDADEGARAASLREALAAYPALSGPRLTHLVEAALADKERRRPPKHARELFRYLRESCAGR